MEGWSAPSLRRSASQASISAPSSSIIRRLVARVPVQGSRPVRHRRVDVGELAARAWDAPRCGRHGRGGLGFRAPNGELALVLSTPATRRVVCHGALVADADVRGLDPTSHPLGKTGTLRVQRRCDRRGLPDRCEQRGRAGAAATRDQTTSALNQATPRSRHRVAFSGHLSDGWCPSIARRPTDAASIAPRTPVR